MGADRRAVLDRAAFDDFAGLFDADELRGMVEQWYADSAAALAAMTDALARADSAQLGEIAHRAAGGGLALGATALARCCERLRAAAESGGAVTGADIAQVRATVEATYAAMKAATDGR
jgi:HPt (histidine-containing phosphotransfer) domain-containing protein